MLPAKPSSVVFSSQSNGPHAAAAAAGAVVSPSDELSAVNPIFKISTTSSSPIPNMPDAPNSSQTVSNSHNNISSTIGHHTHGRWPIFEMPKMNNFADIFSVGCSTAVIFGGLIPYAPQYLKIQRSMNSDGFSTYVCLTLLIANLLRIMFWFGHPFETPLLIQSFVMILGMLAMMELCVRVKVKRASYMISAIGGVGGGGGSTTNRRFQIGLGSGGFWDWDNLFSYVKFLSLFTLMVGLLTYLLIDNYLYVEALGFVAVFTESMLGMPQLLRNYSKKSTVGMSVEMVIMWLSGDLFKTLYFILRRAPVQFYVCGSIQVIVDILILGQVLWYRRPSVTYRKLPKST